VAEILLIRHGQASFGTADYDALSELGLRQASLVGDYLVSNGYRFDGLYCGTLRRQRQTAQQVIDAYAAAGAPAAALREDSGFNEVDNEAQIKLLAPQLARDNAQVRQLMESAHGSKKDFQKLLKIVFGEWQAETCTNPRLQSWQLFKAGVLDALARVQEEQGSGTTSAIFTSGGVIATIVAHVLKMPDSAVYSVFEPVINCSITRLLFRNERVSLSTYNEYSYLKTRGVDAGLPNIITYR
jgi:broad specificity phosphatase PhoE